MNRRQFFGAVAAAAAGASGCTRARRGDVVSVSRSGRRKRVVVVGAGLAGLAAADALRAAGHDVVIVEAQSRPGGRVHTVREPFSDGRYAEAGALFIPNTHDVTLRYVKRFSLPLSSMTPLASVRLFYVRGQRLSAPPGVDVAWPFELTPEERQLGLAGMWQKYLGAALDDIGDVTAPDWPSTPRLIADDGLSIAEFLRMRGASPGAVELLRLAYFNLTGDGIETYSALAMLRTLAERRRETAIFSIQGGNDRLPTALASTLARNIRYDTPVVAIQPGETSATIVIRRGGEHTRLSADHVICTLPFSVLRTLDRGAAWSAQKQAAIDTLPYTSVARVYLQCRRRVWLDDNAYYSATTDLPIKWLYDQTLNQPGPSGILEAQTIGSAARRLNAFAEADRIRFTLEQAARVYPELTAQFDRGATKCWDEDPWARGAFAYFRPGQMQTLRANVARPEGRVHFAGEHTSAWLGWMQGALDSGLRAAREVNEAA